MLNKNAVIILKCIMDRDKCDMESAIWFVKHNQTCYEIARAVANAKDEDAKAEKQALIDKACEWLEDMARYYCNEKMLAKGFKNYLKGGDNE